MKRLAAIAAIALACIQAFCQIQTPNTGGSGGGGGSGIATNANQFGASTTLTIKDGARLTNAHIFGTITNNSFTSLSSANLSVQAGGSAGLYLGGGGLGIFGGQVRIGVGEFRIANTVPLSWSADGTSYGTSDLLLSRDLAATLQLGTDFTSTTTQTIKAHDGSGTDKAGATFQIRGGQSTGTGVGGALAHHTSLTGGSGSGLNSYSTRGYAYAGEKSIADATATGFADITIASGNYVGCDLLITYKAADGFVGWSVNTIRINLSAYNDAGTINAAFSTQQASVIHSLVGTETIGFSTSSPSAGVVRILTTFTSDSWSETPNIKCKWQLLINSDDVATVTPL